MENCFKKHSFQELNNIDMDVFRKIYRKYRYIFHKKNGVYFDIGCNAGSFVRFIENCNKSFSLHCFEPHPILSKKTKEIYPDIIMNNFCLGEENKDIVINIPEFSVGISSIINRPVFKSLNQKIFTHETKMMTLDSYCELTNINQIDFVKIDVEGYEKNILVGCQKSLQNKIIKAGMFEIGETLKDAGTTEEEIENMLYNYGYKVDKTTSKNDYVFYLTKN